MALMTVIAYDVREDSRRSKLAALLQMHGDRIQFSVFLCRVDAEDLGQLLAQARSLIDPRTDSIYALRQCEECWQKVTTIGQARPPQPRLYWAVL
ncbi:MAG: CRISPR-associated endonuclease Cas2 [Micropruina sp.]|nr:MAG: CRISPR-associated endonuclease Cas2 [Micropruina sp.]